MYAALLQHAGDIVWTAVICLIATGVGKLVIARAVMRDSDSGESIFFQQAVGSPFSGIVYSILVFSKRRILRVFIRSPPLVRFWAFQGWLV